MKNLIIILSIFFALSSLAGCSPADPLVLVNSKVSIIKDKEKIGGIGITEGVNKGKEVVPTSLYYEITLKKTNNEQFEDITRLKFVIVPSNDLKETSKSIIGINVFNQEEYSGSGLGHGESITASLKPNKDLVYNSNYALGVDIVDPQFTLKTPSSDKLEKLKEKALDATLIVYRGEKEISRLKLK
ncbi:MAG: hypothetical protein K0S34_1041 [Bacillales bacterium]|jgi:hypothetical protein|nr:hypothetical protein [Bacillales bacterium]